MFEALLMLISLSNVMEFDYHRGKITRPTNGHISSHVRESRRVLDSGFHSVDSGFGVLDSGSPEGLDSKFFCVCFNAFLRFRVQIVLF